MKKNLIQFYKVENEEDIYTLELMTSDLNREEHADFRKKFEAMPKADFTRIDANSIELEISGRYHSIMDIITTLENEDWKWQ
jgi:hypothetical protein